MSARLSFLTVLAGLLAASPAWAAGSSATGEGRAEAQVVSPLVVTRQSDLEFGAVFAGASAGTVTVSSRDGTSYDGGAQPACVNGACHSAHAAEFSVRGEAGRIYLITVPGEIVATGTTTDGAGSAQPLSVSGIIVTSASRPADGATGQLDPQGHDRFDVGGTLELPANLPAASYRATIPVIVTYG